MEFLSTHLALHCNACRQFVEAAAKNFLNGRKLAG
jgi:hypothetical protein